MKRFLIVIVLCVIVLAGCWQLVRPGMVRTHDYVHVARIVEMGRALEDGHFPVRWSQNFGYGYGMPLFQFYAPLPYYVGAVLWLAGLPAVLSLKMLYWLVTIGTTIGAYLLGKEFFGRIGGLVAAAAITLAPYRAVNLYVRGAVGETWGIMAAVWILVGSVLILRRKKSGWWVLLFGLITLFLSHNLVTLIFVPFAVLFVVFWLVFKWIKLHQEKTKQLSTTIWQDSKQYAIQFGSSYLLAGAISAFYLAPAFLEKKFTIVENAILTGYFDFHLHFLYIRQLITPYWGYGGSEWGPDDGISFFLGWGQIVGMTLTGLISGYLIWKHRHKLKEILLQLDMMWILLTLFGLSILMTTPKTLFIWDSISLLKFVQFPWRFLSASIIFGGLLSAYWLKLLKNQLLKVTLTALLVIMMLGNAWYFRSEEYLSNPDDLYYIDEKRIQSQMSGILPDFIPQSLTLLNQPPEKMYVCAPSCEDEESKVLVNKTHQKLVGVYFEQAGQLTMSVASFPGWRAQVDGQNVEVQTSEQGLIKVDVPEGQHLVGLSFESTPTRFWSDLIAILGLLGVLAYYYYQKKFRY